MNEANLSVRFGSQGLSETRRDLSSFADEADAANESINASTKAASSSYVRWWKEAINQQEALWLQAKDDRSKLLDDIQKIETQALQEQWKQEQAQLKTESAERRRQAQEDSQWQILQARANAEAAKASAKDEAAQIKAVKQEEADAAKRIADEENALNKRNAADYVNWWKEALDEKDRRQSLGGGTVFGGGGGNTTSSGGSLGSSGFGADGDWARQFSILAMGFNQTIALATRAKEVVGSFVEDAAKWEAMDVALQNMEGSAKGAATATEQLYQIAKSPAIELATAQHAYLQLRALHVEGSEANRIITEFSNTVARSGGGSVQFERVINQLTQMEANGKVVQQDLRWMKDSMPELATLMDKAFGTTTAEGIRAMHVNAQQFLEGILGQMEKLPRAQQTITSEIENAETATSRLKASFIDSDWVKQVLNQWISMCENITSIINSKSSGWKFSIRAVWGEMHRPTAGLTDIVSAGFGKHSQASQTEDLQEQYLQAYQKSNKYFNRDNIGDIETALTKSKLKVNGLTYSEAEKLLDSTYQPFDMGTGEKQKKSSSVDKVPKGRKPPADTLDKTLENNQKAIDAEKAYNDELAAMRADNIQDAIAKVDAENEKRISAIESERDKELELVDKEEAAKTLTAKKANADRALIEDQTQQKIWQSQQEASNKIRDIYSKEAGEDVKRSQDMDKVLERRLDSINKQIEETKRQQQSTQREVSNKVEANDLDWSTPKGKSPKQIDRYYDTQLQYIDLAAKYDKKVQDDRARYEEDVLKKRQMAQMDFWTSTVTTMGGAMESLTGSMDTLAGNMLGKSSTTYKTLFAISKSFAIADTSISMMDAIGQAWKLPWPSNMAQVAAATAEMGTLLANINSLAYSGVFDKGGDIPAGAYGIAGETGPEIITGPAHVISTRETAAISASKASSDINVQIHNYSGQSVEVKNTSTGDMQVIIGKVMATMEKKLAAGIAQGGSPLDQVLSKTYGVRRG